MESLLTINNLTLKIKDKIFFENFNLEIKKGSFTSIIGSNGSGKSLLTKVLAGILPTDSNIKILNITLNKTNVLKYITKIGVVSNDFNQDFLFKKVKDELAYPLSNLGYLEHDINKQIDSLASFFEIKDLLNKKIETLSLSLKKKLLIILALVHNPTLLILDDAFYGMDTYDEKFMLEKLLELKRKGLTILNITSKLDTIYNSTCVMLLNKLEIEETGSTMDFFNNLKKLKELGFSIPFILDISDKLKRCDLLSKLYFDLEELEGELWK